MGNTVGSSSSNRNLLIDPATSPATQRAQDQIAQTAGGTQRAASKGTAAPVDQLTTDTVPTDTTLRDRIAALGSAPTLPSNSSTTRAELPTSAALSDFMSRT